MKNEQLKKSYKYETVEGDPLETRIYVFDNGLKVFLSVYHDAPRIQTYIAVHTGSKMDPPETTGLAHYFEHMMFKGTENFGTIDWTTESELLGQIEGLFEMYRKEKRDDLRAQLYREIDSLSLKASLLAIPNEYDKLMDAIGSQGSNAGTSNDYTIFMENIPSNQLENWARIEAERFSRPVLRLFHTELETVYEEKNMSLTNDSRKVNEVMMQILFPNHPYGTQTTLGEAEHLKNPSMKNIREFFSKYYVPNNMAICMSGELEPDQTIEIIDRYFCRMKPRPVTPLHYKPWKPLEAPVFKEVFGLEAENIRIGYGFDIKANDEASVLLAMAASVLFNGKAGLIDLNLNQPQKVLNAVAYHGQLADYSMMVLCGNPKSGQSLDDVRDLLICQVQLLKKGEFPGWLPEAIASNTQYDIQKQYESNQGRAMAISHAYLYDIPYRDFTSYIEKMQKIRKDDIVEFASSHLKDNPVIIYKRQGAPEELLKVSKPPITPIHINRHQESAFLKKVKASVVPAEQPEFLDYSKDIDIFHLPDSTRILYKKNTENGTFHLVFYYKIGKNHDKVMNFAIELLPYLGTSKHSVEQINFEFFRLACSFQVNTTDEETTLSIDGLSKNMEQALGLVEELLNDPVIDDDTLRNRVENTLKSRSDRKSDQNEIFSALVSYGIFGSSSPYKNILAEHELLSLTAYQLAEKIKDLKNIRYDILYYGDITRTELAGIITKHHRDSTFIKPAVPQQVFREKETLENKILFAPYDASQAKLQTIIVGGRYDRHLAPVIALFNSYFGDIVFQELREKRALAYTAFSRFQEPADLEKLYLNKGYIATQNDKIMDAFLAFDELFNLLPVSESTFYGSKNALLNKISTERIRRMNCIWNFLNAEKLGLNQDIRKEIFEKVSIMTLDDMIAFQEKNLKNKAKTYLVLGRESAIGFNALGDIGPVIKLTLKDLFGY
jgi:predicted Zn-dependent peptidase